MACWGLRPPIFPAGDYRLEADFGDSPVRRAGNLVTMLALGIVLAVALNPRRWWLRVAVGNGQQRDRFRLLVTYGGAAARVTGYTCALPCRVCQRRVAD